MFTRGTAIWSRIRRWFSPTEWFVRWFRLPKEDATTHDRGLVLIQIDGLSREQLQAAIDAGRMPFLSSLLHREHYLLHDFFSGLPSSTPSVQGELFYGQPCIVPAFEFRDHRNGDVVRMFARDVAADVERVLEQADAGILKGGSAYCNLYGGGAQEAHFCASSLGWDDLLTSVNSWKRFALLCWHGWSVMRMLGLVTVEFFLALGGFVRGALNGSEYWQELLMIPARVVVVILMRELAVIGGTMDVTRGLPIVQLNLLGYDEQAHRRGPESAFAHWTVKGMDRAMERLWRSAHRSEKREYDVWVYSDHGQVTTTPYEYVTGKRIGQAAAEAVEEVCGQAIGGCQSLDSKLLTASRARWLGAGRLVGMLFGEDDEDRQAAHNGVQVAALGPLGLIYSNRELSEEERVQIGERLVRDHGVPIAFVQTATSVVALNPQGRFDLKTEPERVFGTDHPFLQEVAQDMIQLCQHADAGDVVVSGWVPHGESMSFVRQSGAHAGPSPEETNAFVLVPSDIDVRANGKPYLRPNDLRLAVKEFLHTDNSTPARELWKDSVQHLRIMTYNVHACVGMDQQLAPRRIARVISQSQADIVALQELDVRRARSGFRDQAEEIARLLEMECHFHPAWELEEESYGDAVLSRLPMRLIRKGQLPAASDKREPRGAIWVEVQTEDGSTVQVINTHLSLYPRERNIQAESLARDWVRQAQARGDTIVCGDFNAPPNSPAYRHLNRIARDVQSYNTNGKPAPTFFSPRPMTRIDHVFVSENIRVEAARVLDSRLARTASDHLPLVADLSVAQKELLVITH